MLVVPGEVKLDLLPFLEAHVLAWYHFIDHRVKNKDNAASVTIDITTDGIIRLVAAYLVTDLLGSLGRSHRDSLLSHEGLPPLTSSFDAPPLTGHGPHT